jgi:hypothetical protein
MATRSPGAGQTSRPPYFTHATPPGKRATKISLTVLTMSVIGIFHQLALAWCLLLGMTVHWNQVVKMVLRLAGRGLFICALLFATGLWYPTAHGHMTWWFRSSSQVAVDGVRNGFLYVNWHHSAVIITRTDLRPSQSYLVRLSGGKSLTHCGDWKAPRLPAFTIGDVNPPCSFFSNGSDSPVADNAVLSTLATRPGFVEFQTERGKKVTASW